MTRSGRQVTLGVLGGMGGLASAEFLKTIYEYSGELHGSEQESPVIVVDSDPSFPDRTEAFLKGDDALLLQRLIEALERLCELGAPRIVICCMTIHYLLPRLPLILRERIISLLDVIVTRLEHFPKQYLLVCSRGTRELGLLQGHERWKFVEDYIVFPDESDQQMIHDLIYQVKRNRAIPETLAFLEALLARYRVDSFIAGCSEIHLLAKAFSSNRNDQNGCIDPLAIIARQVTEQYTHEA